MTSEPSPSPPGSTVLGPEPPDGDGTGAGEPPTIPDNIGRYQTVVRRLLQPIARRLWEFDVHGLANVPATGPAVLCPNHVAAIDSFLMPAMLDRNVIFVGKAEYLDDWKTRRLFPALGMIPIDRRGGNKAKAALDAARAVLEQGELFAIYPEGTRSRSGKLHKGHTGAARLAVETGAPIIPVGILGSAEIQPVDTVVPKFFRPVTIKFGEPLHVDRYRHRVGDRAIYRELIDEVMYEIKQLTGLPYEHVYAGKAARTEAPAVPAPAPEAERAEAPAEVPAEAGVDAEIGVGVGTGPEPLSSRQVLGSQPMVPLDAVLAAG